MGGPAGHTAAAIGLVGGDKVADVEIGFPGKFESEINPIFEFLIGGRFQDRQVHMLAEIPGIRRHLRRIAPRVVADEHQRAAIRMCAGKITKRERICRHVQADRLHRANAAQRRHLRTIEHGRAERFVVGDAPANAVGFEQGSDFLHGIEETRHGGTGVAGE